MRKSDIVVAILTGRFEDPPDEKLIRKQLSTLLNELSLDPEKWDEDLDPILANSIIKHVGSVKGDLPLTDLTRDIDIMLKRLL